MIKLGTNRNNWKVSKEKVDLRRDGLQAQPITISAESQELTFDLNDVAIIIVDMQNDFCSQGGWLDYIGADYKLLQKPISPLNQILPLLRQQGVPVIWLNWGNRRDRQNLSPSVLHVYNMDGAGKGIGEPLPGTQSRVLEKGSWGASIVSELLVEPDDIQVDKYRMSGFCDTPLNSILHNLNIHTVLFAGVNLDQCVMATLQDAVNQGFDAILLDDCCATNSPSYCESATYYNIIQCYGFITSSTTIVHALKTAVLNT